MSTKTNFKRVALVAVAALGLGVLTSVAPANAGTNVADITAGSALNIGVVTAIATPSTSANADLTATMVSNGRLSVNVSAGTGASNVTVSGGTFAGVTSGVASYSSSGLTATSTSGVAIVSLIIVPNAGVTSMTIKSYDGAVATANLQDTLTVSVVPATSVGVLSAADSFANIHSGVAAAEVTTMADTADAERVANGGQGYIRYTIHDGNDVAMPATTVVTASASNGAVVSFTSATYLGTSAVDTYPTSSDYDTIYVAQGTANAAIDTVVTISVNSVVWATKSFKLLGDVATIELAAGTDGVYGQTSTTQTKGINLKVKDSLGRLLTSVGTTISGQSYNTSVTGFGSTTTGASTTLGTQVSFTCSATKGSSDVKVSKKNAANATITSNTLKVFCVGTAYSYSASLDKASYVPGDIATLTITAKDSAGNPASDVSVVGAAAAIAGSNMTPVTALTSVDTFTAGVKKYTFIVGSTEGSYSMSVSLTDIDDAVTVPYKIAGSGGVSNADVLKAIVSLIASINKQIAALQKALLKR